MKEYQIDIQRTYTTTIILRFPNDSRDHKAIIDKKYIRRRRNGMGFNI